MSELNDKILKAIEDNSEQIVYEEGEKLIGSTVVNKTEAAKAIEILVLEEMLDMLKRMDGQMDILSKRMDLREILNQLKQQ